jgi:hypothetical protein
MTLDDDEAPARAANLNSRAFAAIYERHRTFVYRYLRSRTPRTTRLASSVP